MRSSLVCRSSQTASGNPFASTGSMRCSTCSLPLADHTSFFSQTGINYHGAVKA